MKPGLQRDLAMIRAYDAGTPVKDIGDRQAVYRALRRHDRGPSRTRCKWADIASLRAAGWSMSQIMVELECAASTVYRALRKMEQK